MDLYGWIIFVFSNALVLGLVIVCFIRVFRSGGAERMHAPLDIDTRDTNSSVQAPPEA